MRGSAAQVEMTGRVDLARETQDLKVRIIPSLGDSAAAALALRQPAADLPGGGRAARAEGPARPHLLVRVRGHRHLVQPEREAHQRRRARAGAQRRQIVENRSVNSPVTEKIALASRYRHHHPAHAVRPRGRQARARLRHARRAQGRLRRPLLPVLALRGLEPGGGHRQVGQLQHRAGRRRARRVRREDRLRLLRRDQLRRAAGRGQGDARDRRRRADRRIKSNVPQAATSCPCTARSIRSPRSTRRTRWRCSRSWRRSAARSTRASRR